MAERSGFEPFETVAERPPQEPTVAARPPQPTGYLCVDFGSTFTKAALVDGTSGELIGVAQHPTTLDTDVLDGLDACIAALPDVAADAEVLACSSAGGGLRIAVVGNEELVTAEAGRRVALSSGGKVVLVLAGGLDSARLTELRDSAPDIVLLVGGTDGGNSDPLRADARFLADHAWPGPVVVAGDVEARDDVAALLERGRVPHVLADNVVPRIGVLAPGSARSAIREAFLAHVIGGKHLSSRTDFADMVRGATPDVVLAGVELVARSLDGTSAELTTGVVVVDVGGATTDVHSVVPLDPEEAQLSRDVVAPTAVTRTVEGDLGMRWSASSTVEAAVQAGLVPDDLTAAGVRRTADPSYLPADEQERAEDEAIARAAIILALRRHAGRSKVVLTPEGKVVERTGKDLREVDVLIGSGGVLRADVPAAERILAAATGPDPEGWQLPERPRVVVDADYALAALGLLARVSPDLAERFLWHSLSSWRGLRGTD